MRAESHEERADVRCARIAARQHGVLHRAQALEAGMSEGAIKRRLADGTWHAELPKVYAWASSPLTWLRRCKSVELWAGSDGAIGYSAAAFLLGLYEVAPTTIDVVSVRCLKCPRPWISVHRPVSLPTTGIVEVSGIRVTRVGRTLIDLSSTLDEDGMEVLVDTALRRRLTTLPRLRWEVGQDAGRGRKGTAALRALVESKSPAVVESPLETRFLQLVRTSQLPIPVAQHEVRGPDGFYARLDFCYPAAKLAIELDGYRHHSGRVAWVRDARRANRLVQDGWTLLRFTWDDVVNRPADVVRSIRVVLGNRVLGEF